VKGRKIPSEEKVKEVIKEILKSRLKVESQEELSHLALIQLKKENKNFTLSPTRAKRIALQIPEIEVKAKTKKVPKMQKIGKCPICGSAVEEIRIKNLLNKAIVVGYRCINCGYQSDLEAFVPMKYIFLFKCR
jgi:ssDNA-binding Zn-finger/Zn-ribbon topoisomerase 1